MAADIGGSELFSESVGVLFCPTHVIRVFVDFIKSSSLLLAMGLISPFPFNMIGRIVFIVATSCYPQYAKRDVFQTGDALSYCVPIKSSNPQHTHLKIDSMNIILMI